MIYIDDLPPNVDELTTLRREQNLWYYMSVRYLQFRVHSECGKLKSDINYGPGADPPTEEPDLTRPYNKYNYFHPEDHQESFDDHIPPRFEWSEQEINEYVDWCIETDPHEARGTWIGKVLIREQAIMNLNNIARDAVHKLRIQLLISRHRKELEVNEELNRQPNQPSHEEQQECIDDQEVNED